MSIADTLLPEFDQEMATTRKVIERVPTDQGKFKPHPKSFSLGHLTQLVSTMPGWITNAVTQTSLNLGDYPGYSYEKTDDPILCVCPTEDYLNRVWAAAEPVKEQVYFALYHEVLGNPPAAKIWRSYDAVEHDLPDRVGIRPGGVED